MRNPYQRIVCLTEETTEILYLLGEDDRIVGISGYTVRPPQARREKPKICAFTKAKINEIIQLKPDLVIGFSDLQADIASDLIKQGIEVHVYNQRTVSEIFNMIDSLTGMIGISGKGVNLVRQLEQGMEDIRLHGEKRTQHVGRKPRVFFEEWDDPLISSISWVSELIGIAGGEETFPHLSSKSLAKDRIIADHSEVIASNPDIIIGSWCGKKFRPERVRERPGWDTISALQGNHLYEIKSSLILQPGPAALTDGLLQLSEIFDHWGDSQKNA